MESSSAVVEVQKRKEQMPIVPALLISALLFGTVFLWWSYSQAPLEFSSTQWKTWRQNKGDASRLRMSKLLIGQKVLIGKSKAAVEALLGAGVGDLTDDGRGSVKYDVNPDVGFASELSLRVWFDHGKVTETDLYENH